jgi:hypothetical protein
MRISKFRATVAAVFAVAVIAVGAAGAVAGGSAMADQKVSDSSFQLADQDCCVN